MGKFFAETMFSPKVLCYFLKLNPSHSMELIDFDRGRESGMTSDSLKFLMHKHIIRLIDNMHVNTTYNRKIRF